VSKARHPDVLVMTATPIPRTLALTIYGDLDISVIDEMPPGRRPIQTRHVTDDRVESVYSFMKREIAKGRQAYVVYPVIEESEAMKAAQQMYRHLSQQVFPDIRVGLLHGKLKPDEKETVMEQFRRGEVKILVSTTVIEVGVDVPNATAMVIEQAERFGWRSCTSSAGAWDGARNKVTAFWLPANSAMPRANASGLWWNPRTASTSPKWI
jgi:ATP-dependent DNA helicase RecG